MNADERLDHAVQILSKHGAIDRIEVDIGTEEADSFVYDARVFLQGLYREHDVKQWLDFSDEELDVEVSPGELKPDENVAYASIHIFEN